MSQIEALIEAFRCFCFNSEIYCYICCLQWCGTIDCISGYFQYLLQSRKSDRDLQVVNWTLRRMKLYTFTKIDLMCVSQTLLGQKTVCPNFRKPEETFSFSINLLNIFVSTCYVCKTQGNRNQICQVLFLIPQICYLKNEFCLVPPSKKDLKGLSILVADSLFFFC